MLAARRKIVRIIRYLPPEKLERLLKYAEELDEEMLTPAEIAAIEEGKRQIERGECVTLDEFCRRFNL
ncbi:MAG: hypothetical protein ACUVTU_11505 [Desulfurispora sp.]|uniref:hypothetical protein n=1 Tax=Desulfurispora sp. TaxID=3014275 RepID=UPI00404A5F1E